jgi:hypothetical protein
MKDTLLTYQNDVLEYISSKKPLGILEMLLLLEKYNHIIKRNYMNFNDPWIVGDFIISEENRIFNGK